MWFRANIYHLELRKVEMYSSTHAHTQPMVDSSTSPPQPQAQSIPSSAACLQVHCFLIMQFFSLPKCWTLVCCRRLVQIILCIISTWIQIQVALLTNLLICGWVGHERSLDSQPNRKVVGSNPYNEVLQVFVIEEEGAGIQSMVQRKWCLCQLHGFTGEGWERGLSVSIIPISNAASKNCFCQVVILFAQGDINRCSHLIGSKRIEFPLRLTRQG